MMYEFKLENILFLDIETVPASSFNELTERKQALWETRSARLRTDDETPADVWSKAALYAEFGKIVCISVGLFSNLSEPRRFRIKSFYGTDEQKIIREFGDLIKNSKKGKNLQLCAHNGKEFDFPYLARRFVIMGERLPDILNIAGKKPWEVNFIDTMELWKFGEFRNYSSLALLTEVLGISNPKDDLDGSQVGEVYEAGDFDRIARYCEKDVLAVAQVLLRLRGDKLIPEENVEVIGSMRLS